MNPRDPNGWPNLFVRKRFFEPSLCETIVAEMRAAQGSPATVYGRVDEGAIDSSVRNTVRVAPAGETVELVTQRLLSCKEAIEQYFDLKLNECEDPQFLRYKEGDFFVAHQDGNTGLLRLESERRLISTVVFLSRESDLPEPNTHGGGSLVFTNLRAPAPVRVMAEPNTLVAFRSETTHEVTRVTRGERLSIVSWYK